MSAHASSWLSRRKWFLVAVGIPILVRGLVLPLERLWINAKVNE